MDLLADGGNSRSERCWLGRDATLGDGSGVAGRRTGAWRDGRHCGGPHAAREPGGAARAGPPARAGRRAKACCTPARPRAAGPSRRRWPRWRRASAASSTCRLRRARRLTLGDRAAETTPCQVRPGRLAVRPRLGLRPLDAVLFRPQPRATATEEQVLGILCQGFSAPQIAAQMKVAVSTVRSHVRSLCIKTRSSGVRELVSRIAVLPPVAPPFWHEPMH